MIGPLLGLTLSVGGSFFGGVLGKVLKWQWGGPEGGLFMLSLDREREHRRQR